MPQYERNGPPSIFKLACPHQWEPTAFQPKMLPNGLRREICRQCNSIENRRHYITIGEERPPQCFEGGSKETCSCPDCGPCLVQMGD